MMQRVMSLGPGSPTLYMKSCKPEFRSLDCAGLVQFRNFFAHSKMTAVWVVAIIVSLILLAAFMFGRWVVTPLLEAIANASAPPSDSEAVALMQEVSDPADVGLFGEGTNTLI